MKKLLFCMLIACAMLKANATIHTVNNEVGASADFSNVPNAMGAAVNGDTIYVQPSSLSYGDLTINKRVVLMGAGHNPTFSPYNSSFATITLANGASNCILKGLNITVINSASGSPTVNNVVFSGCRIIASGAPFQLALGNFNNWIFEGCIIEAIGGVPVNCSYLGSNLIFRNNFIQTISYPANLINVPSGTLFDHNFFVQKGTSAYDGVVSGLNVYFTNNIIATTSSTNYGAQASCASCTFDNNFLYPLGSAQFTTPPGSNNFINQNPLLTYFFYSATNTYEYTYDLQLSELSIGHNASTDGTDIGLYGGIFNFSPIGIDSGSPHIIDFSLGSSSAPQGGTITIHLNASGSGQ